MSMAYIVMLLFVNNTAYVTPGPFDDLPDTFPMKNNKFRLLVFPGEETCFYQYVQETVGFAVKVRYNACLLVFLEYLFLFLVNNVCLL